MIDVTLVGTSGMLPLPDRWLASLWLEYNGKACLVDCGEGTQIAINQHKLKLSHLDILLITHTHADHISGLPGLLLSLGNCGKTDTLHIYSHKGISRTINSLMCISPVLPFDIEIHELPLNEISSFLWNDITISAIPLDHSVNCLGYSFILNRKPVFNPQKAKSLGVDVKYWKALHNGESISIDDKIITTDMVTDTPRPPIKITYVTDTRYFSALSEFAENSDLLVCEGMYGDDEYIEKMLEKGHMVFSQSAKIAIESRSRRLWLTHYSPALINPHEYGDFICSIFPDTTISSDGEHISLK